MYYMDPTREYDRSEEEPRCTCYKGSVPWLQDGPCPYCEEQAEIEDTYGPTPPEPTNEGEPMPDLLLLAIHNADLSEQSMVRLAHCYASQRPDNPIAARYLILAPMLVQATIEGDQDRVARLTAELDYEVEL